MRSFSTAMQPPTVKERKFFEDVSVDMDDVTATFAVYQLSLYLSRHYGKNL